MAASSCSDSALEATFINSFEDLNLKLKDLTLSATGGLFKKSTSFQKASLIIYTLVRSCG